MKFITHTHREGLDILENRLRKQWVALQDVIESISDEDLVTTFEQHNDPRPKNKSLSVTINQLLKNRFVAAGWTKEAAIFHDPEYSRARETVWRLDFAKDAISIEVSFNHGEALAWNLTKPTLASDLNHVDKAIKTEVGVVILATQEMKEAGGFDGAVGTYEKTKRYLAPMQHILTIPMVLVGLKAPENFKIDWYDYNGEFGGKSGVRGRINKF